jgi:hypothetical protein
MADIEKTRTARTRRIRLAAGATAAVAAALMLAGCTGSPTHVEGASTPAGSSSSKDESPSASPEDATPSSESSEDETSAAKSPGEDDADEGTSSHSGTTTKQSGTSRCHTGDLKAHVGPNHPGAGQENFAVVLTNTSGETCTVYGYPGAAFINSKGQNVSIDPHREGGPKPRISLGPGESAWSALSYSNPNMTGVATVVPDAILITPPDERQSLKVNWPGDEVTRSGAASVASLSPLRPGDGT